jgi:hypothetical protein
MNIHWAFTNNELEGIQKETEVFNFRYYPDMPEGSSEDNEANSSLI